MKKANSWSRKKKEVQGDENSSSETGSDIGFWKQERKDPCMRIKKAKQMRMRSQSKLNLRISRSLETKWKREVKRWLGKACFVFTGSTGAKS